MLQQGASIGRFCWLVCGKKLWTIFTGAYCAPALVLYTLYTCKNSQNNTMACSHVKYQKQICITLLYKVDYEIQCDQYKSINVIHGLKTHIQQKCINKQNQNCLEAHEILTRWARDLIFLKMTITNSRHHNIKARAHQMAVNHSNFK